MPSFHSFVQKLPGFVGGILPVLLLAARESKGT